jgi:hypothetical protein
MLKKRAVRASSQDAQFCSLIMRKLWQITLPRACFMARDRFVVIGSDQACATCLQPMKILQIYRCICNRKHVDTRSHTSGCRNSLSLRLIRTKETPSAAAAPLVMSEVLILIVDGRSEQLSLEDNDYALLNLH